VVHRLAVLVKDEAFHRWLAASQARRSLNMKTLPWEVLEDVVISACMDDGSTARALSGVSHAVRDSTAPLRFRTLVLRGAHQISRFLAFLDRLDHPVPAASPTWWLKKKTPVSRLTPLVVDVHHLFLADCAEERRGKPPAWTDWQDYYEVQPRTTAPTTTSVTHRITTERTWRMASEAATAAVQRLLIRLSPTLQHLCYSKRMAGGHGPVYALLPSLVELTCHFAVPAPHHAYSLGDVHHPQDLPALRRLHMVLGKVESHHVHFHGFVLPPLLTHFRHSEVEDPKRLLWYLHYNPVMSPSTWPLSLEAILIAPRAPALPSRRAKDPPSSVSRWVNPVVSSSESPAAVKKWDLCAWRAAANREGSFGRIRVVREDQPYDMQRLFDEWLDRVQGGVGCWVDASR
jgi:hypothetical protein